MSDPKLGKPGGAMIGNGGISRTWASVLGRHLTPADEISVLEVVMEKDTRGGFLVTDVECCNLSGS